MERQAGKKYNSKDELVLPARSFYPDPYSSSEPPALLSHLYP